MSSKLVNIGSMMGNTFEERVDRLISKSNQGPPQYQRGNSSSCSYEGNSYPRTPRLKKFQDPNSQEPKNDVRQNLRGPVPSAAGPFGESEGSRLIQCFRCRGWGHPKRLSPSRLNYTRGVIWGPSSQRVDRQPENPENLPPNNPSPQQ